MFLSRSFSKKRQLFKTQGHATRGERMTRLAFEVLEPRAMLAAEFNGPLAGWINVEAAPYNAYGDGVHDDTAAIQAALNAANCQNWNTPGYSPDVYLPAGTYKISATLNFNITTGGAGTRLIGADPTTTSIVWAGAAGGTMISVLGMQQWQVDRLTLEGSSSASTILVAGGLVSGGNFNSGGTITDDIFRDSTIGIQGGNAAGPAAEVTIERCQFLSDGTGIELNNSNSLDWWIWDSTFSDNAIAINNTGPSGAGDFMVERSVFDDSTAADVRVGNCNGPDLVQSCFSSGSARFFCENGEYGSACNLTLEDNTVLDTTSTAVEFHDFTPLTMWDNIFRTTSTAVVFEHSTYQGEFNLAAGQLLSIGNQFSYCGAPVTGCTRLLEINDQTGVNLSGISGTPPAPAAFLPLVIRYTVVVDTSTYGYTGTAIQNAINAAVAYDNANGGNQAPIVDIPYGDYAVPQTIVVPNGSDIQIIGDSNAWCHESALFWAGPVGGTVLDLGSESHVVLKDISVYGESARNLPVTAGDLIRVDDADQAGSRVYIDGGKIGSYNTRDFGLVSDQLDNTRVQLTNTWSAGIEVIGGALAASGVATPGVTAAYGNTGAGAQFSTGDCPTFSVQNGGTLLISSWWREGPSNVPVIDLTGSGTLAVQGMMDDSYAGSTTPAAIEADGFDGQATFVNTATVFNAASQFGNTHAVVNGSAPTQFLFADSGTWTNPTLVDNLTNPSANAVALNNIWDLPDNSNQISAPNQGAASNAWLLAMLAPLRTDLPQVLGADLAAGITDVQLFNVTAMDGTVGLHIYGNPTTIPVTTTPAAPSNLTATAVSNSQVNLTWTVNSNNQSGFKVERATDSSFTQNLTLLTTTAANAWCYNDSTATAGTTYYYRVRATNAIGDSNNCAPASVATYAVAAPSGLTATPITTTKINLSWTAPSGTILGYNVYCGPLGDGAEGTTPINGSLIPAGTTTYSDTTVAPDKVYSYIVTAVAASGNSAASNEVQTLTTAVNAPTGLTAMPVLPTQINLSWEAPCGIARGTFTGYNIYRGTTPGGENYSSPINGSTMVTTTTYSDTTAVAGTTYYYTVEANTVVGPSPASGEAGVYYLPADTVSVAYDQTLTASGGTGTSTLTVSDIQNPIAGLVLLASGNALSITGTPTATGTETFTVTASDALGATATVNYSITVNPAVSLGPANLPADTVSVAYDQTLTVSGGTGSEGLAVSDIQNPIAGLVLLASGNALNITGTPTATGTETFTVTASDALGATATVNYSITVNPAVSLGPANLPADTVSVAYDQTLTVSGGTGSEGLAASDIQNPIAGLVLLASGNSLSITGTPTATGTETFTVTATDALGATATVNYSITVNPAVALGPANLPADTVSVAYDQTLTASGGTGSEGLAVSDIQNPIAGLVLLASGNALSITGTPTATGTETFTVTASDALGATATVNYSITVNPAVAFGPANLPAGTVSVAYDQTLTASGGTGSEGLAVSDIQNPIAGLVLLASGNALCITGTPTATGTETFTVTASDALGATATVNYSITVNPAVALGPANLPADTVSVAYDQTLTASGGTGTSTLTVSDIQNPIVGLVLLASGNSLSITGTPTATGTETFTVTASDALGATATVNYSITVNPAVALGPANLPADTVSVAYDQTLTASGGTGSKGLAVSDIQNPIAGMVLLASGNSLSITGTPTETGTETFTVTATDALGATATVNYSITVDNAVWNGSASGNLSDPANWVAGVAPNPALDELFLGGPAASSPLNDFPVGSTFNGLTFDGGCVLSGNSILLDSTISNAQGDNSMSLPMEFGDDAFFQVSSGSLVVGGAIDNGSHLLTVNTAGTSAATISSAISGAGGLIKSGTGTLTLSGANAYSGGSVVLAGTLLITSASSLPSGGNLTVGAGGILDFDPSATATAALPTSIATLDTPAAAGAQNQPLAAASSVPLASGSSASLAQTPAWQAFAAGATSASASPSLAADANDAGVALSGLANIKQRLANAADELWEAMQLQARQRLQGPDQALLTRDTILAEYAR